MRLLTKINRSFLLSSIILFIICSLLFFFLLRSVIHSNQDEDLQEQQAQIITFVKEKGRLPVSQSFSGEYLEVRKEKSGEQISGQLQDTMIYDAGEEELVQYRQLSFPVTYQNEDYIVTVGVSKFESDDLITTILIFMLLFISALFTVLFLINRRISKKIWLPFNTTLERLKAFDLMGQHKISFSDSSITEFRELNQSLNKMTEKIYEDYSRLKQFTENASHEIQTPLSIIRSRIETLIQSENISEEEMYAIQKINEAVSRLSKLNIGLLTLTKIGNRQFTDEAEIHLPTFIRKKISDLEEFLQQKKIMLSLDAEENIMIRMNTALADLLFDNLISNAIKHNIENGTVKICIQHNQFIISNSGAPLQISPEKLFDRFVKNNPSGDSLGLGLAIVKQICLCYHFQINFTSKANLHSITLSF